jgi:hypothetical protein
MLIYKDKPIKDQMQLQPGLIHVRHFLQTFLSCQPDAITENIGPIGASTLINKNDLSLNGTVLSLKQVTPHTGSGKQEAYNNQLNRFLPTKNHMILLNIGPGTRQYYTRTTTLLLEPGDMIVISPDIDVFYGRCMVTEVLNEKTEPETLIIQMEN